MNDKLTKEDIEFLQEIINEEIIRYLESGYSIKTEYIKLLRNLLKKLGMKETYSLNNYE